MLGGLTPAAADCCCSKVGQKRWGGMVGKLLKESADTSNTAVGGFDAGTSLSKEEFQQLLTTIDAGLRALPATAQVCLGVRVQAQSASRDLAVSNYRRPLPVRGVSGRSAAFPI